MAESKIKRYQFENNNLYDKFEREDSKLENIGLIYLTTTYYDRKTFKIWNSYFHHDSGSSIIIRKNGQLNKLDIIGLENNINLAKSAIEIKFGKLIEV